MELIMTTAEIVTAIGIWVMVVLLVKQLRRPLPTPQVTVEAPKIELPAPVVHVQAPAPVVVPSAPQPAVPPVPTYHCKVLELRDGEWHLKSDVRAGKPDYQRAIDTPGLAIRKPDGSIEYGVQE